MSCLKLLARALRLPRLVAGSLIAPLFAALFLISCGGGTGQLLSGVGSGGSGLAEGTITGFGSVYVDDVRYDDSAASVSQAASDGSNPHATLKLGQRVRVTSSRQGVADTIEVITELMGPVGIAPAAAGAGVSWMKIVGQWVRIDDGSASADVAPTVIDYGTDNCTPAGACRIDVNDWVQAHGSWVYDASKAAHVLRATRLEKLTVNDPNNAQNPVLVSGVVNSTSGTRIRLNEASGLEIDTQSGVGQGGSGTSVVRAWLRQGSLGAPAPQALRTENAALPSPASSSGSSTVLGGEIAQVVGDTVTIQGMAVAIPPGTDRTLLVSGKFAQLELEAPAGNWQIKGAPRAPEGSLRGTVRIEESISGARLADLGSRGIRLRDTPLLPVGAADFAAGGCPPLVSASRVQVTVTARRGPLPLAVTAIECRPQ